MASEQTILQKKILGSLTAFDRLIFHGHLLALFPRGAMERLLNHAGVLAKDFKTYVAKKSREVVASAKAMAATQKRPFEYLAGACTRASGDPKRKKAEEIAAKDGIKEGLICVFSTLEPCKSFKGVYSAAKGHPEIVSQKRKCLHLYFYFMDREFGLMHVRLQTWFPFQVQVYMNGREWLSRIFDRDGIGYERYENSFTKVSDLEAAQEHAEKLAHREMAPILQQFAQRVNPLVDEIAQAGFGSYYWCIDQAEIATDVMFTSRKDLETLMPDLYDHAIRLFSAKDVMRFLGKKLHPRFEGEITTKHHERPEGRCVRHQAGRNSIKMYDKMSVLRIETTVNNPRDFKVLKLQEDERTWRWSPMGKGVANLFRCAQIGDQANRRYLDALGSIQPKGEAIDALDALCRSHTRDGKRISKFQPVTRQDCQVFEAVLDGGHLLSPFKNGDIDKKLHPEPATTLQEARRRSSQTWRLLTKLRGHHLIARIPNTRFYRVTKHGIRVMSAAIHYRNPEFPTLYANTA